MHGAILVLSAASFFVLPISAQSPIDVEDLAHHPFKAAFPSGGQLDLRIRSAEIHIVGSADNRLAVHVGGKRGSTSTDVKARFEQSGKHGELQISGGPSSELAITVVVPRDSSLFIRINAGDVEVKGVRGDKDVELHAGDLTIDVGDPADYAHVEASVTTGAIEASPFGESHGGMFRSFEKSGRGKYRLAAHVGAGDLTLR
jgi:hypothetical protein